MQREVGAAKLLDYEPLIWIFPSFFFCVLKLNQAKIKKTEIITLIKIFFPSWYISLDHSFWHTVYIYGSVFFNRVWKKNRFFSNFGDLFRKSFWAIIHLKKIFWADEGQVSRLWKWSVLCFWRKLIFFNWDFLWEENFFYISKYTYLL